LGDKVEEALFGYKPSSQTHLWYNIGFCNSKDKKLFSLCFWYVIQFLKPWMWEDDRMVIGGLKSFLMLWLEAVKPHDISPYNPPHKMIAFF
jgi:hypothetical protein